MAPKGVINVAKGKKVTASDKKPITGTLDQISDGEKDAYDEKVVEMRKGTQWVQVDLEQSYPIHAIAIWHDFRWCQFFHDVVVQISNDVDFTNNVHTLFNNDLDNSSGLGIGTDKEYFETYQGRIIDAKGINARYVRSYTRGSGLCKLNNMQEVEVYALPAEIGATSSNENTSTNLAPLQLNLPMPSRK